MRRSTCLLLLTAFTSSLAIGACQEEGYDCTAKFFESQGGAVVAEIDYDYDDAGSADEATDMCKMDAPADQPAGSNYFTCSCESR